MTDILLPLPGRIRLRLSTAALRPAVWLVNLLQSALVAGPEGLVLQERMDLVCDGFAIDNGRARTGEGDRAAHRQR